MTNNLAYVFWLPIFIPPDILHRSGVIGSKIVPFCCYIRSVNIPCMTDFGGDRIRLESWSSCKFCCYASYDIRPQSCSISRQVSLPWVEDSQNFSATSVLPILDAKPALGTQRGHPELESPTLPLVPTKWKLPSGVWNPSPDRCGTMRDARTAGNLRPDFYIGVGTSQRRVPSFASHHEYLFSRKKSSQF